MPKAKQVAATLTNILENPLMVGIRDRGHDVVSLIDKIDALWVYDLFSRNPSAAQHDDAGNLICATDLDLATFLYALWDREAVINIPEYHSMRGGTKQEGQMVVSDKNRHGKIMGLTAHKEVFTFGIRIFDQNVMTTDGTGHPRTFNVTGLNGEWYDGWNTIEFMPTAAENKFMMESGILTDNKIVFDNFVSPERWISFYGQYYFLTKSMLDRLTEEKKHLIHEWDRLSSTGIVLSDDKEGVINTYKTTTSEREKTKPVKVEYFLVEIDTPDIETSFEEYDKNEDALRTIKNKLKAVKTAQAKFRFTTRCVEFAASREGTDSFPTWIQNVNWEPDKIKRTTWNRLKITQPSVGERSVSLRYRVKEGTQQVNTRSNIPSRVELITEGKL